MRLLLVGRMRGGRPGERRGLHLQLNTGKSVSEAQKFGAADSNKFWRWWSWLERSEI